MFPIGDDDSDRTITPYVNYALIGINILVFLLLQQLGSNDSFTYAFSLVPREVTTGVDLQGLVNITDAGGKIIGQIPQYAAPFGVYFNLLSSMFMHSGFMHIFGNMLFLWVFGDNLENRLGHIRYLAFYLVCGFAAAAAQIALNTDSAIPMLGASGAISGVLGGYLLLFPRRRVRAVIFNFLTEVPAYVAVGIWIVYQIVVGYLSSADSGGVAYAAHVGGFFAGLILVKVFAVGLNQKS
ncbi:MAG: rhomboid family intramembrane serine protease [Acidobacteriota bacterium]|nr:rhomboid family intramembrane serine protease [Acidobacteriota bacterium]